MNISSANRSLPLILALFICLIYVYGLFIAHNWKNSMEYGDTSGYYLHAVSIFLYQDVGDYSKSLESYFESFPNAKQLLDDPYWLKKTETDKKYLKYPLGVAFMEAPAFLVAHIYASINKNYNNDGWSSPYIIAINIIQIFYVSLAFYLLFNVLIFYFKTETVVLTLLSIALGTNLFIQATSLTMAHTFQFFNISLLIYITNRFYRKPSLSKAIWIGATIGLIGMCRTPEIIAFLIPIFWGICDKQSFLKRTHFIKAHYNYYLVAILAMIIFISPQLIYWNFVSGELLFNSYGEEDFNFLKPQILKGWFNFKNGWLVYTPLMLLSLIGTFMARKKVPEVILPIILFVGLNTYIHYSYYQWNYFPGLGSRPMIESYPLLCFGIASFLSVMNNKFFSKIISYVLISGFISLNLFQTWQSNKGIIISERSNRAFFWESFLDTKQSKANLIAFDTNEPQPNEKNLIFDQTIYIDNFEDDKYSDENTISGSRSLKITPTSPGFNLTFEFGEHNIKGGSYLKISFFGFINKEQFNPSFDGRERITTQIFNSEGKSKRYRGISVTPYLGNKNYSIWHQGEAEIWDSISYYIQVPKEAKEDWYFTSFIHNPSQKEFFIDDFQIDLYK